ncbi:MAG: hypothetical protein JRH20_08120 [Deltaproteobacteria bacterium]|nr:hypothetical protein [Deltaproteobacteria bacterium]
MIRWPSPDPRLEIVRHFDDDNAVRFEAGQIEAGETRQGHVESYFMRANDPKRARALWLKATIYAPKVGRRQADVWCALFDGDHTEQPTWAQRQTVPFEQARFEGEPLSISIAGCDFLFSPGGGHAQGRLAGCQWDLRWENTPAPLGAPLSLYPKPSLETGFFPRSKLLTPAPVCHVRGTLSWPGEQEWSLNRWPGMQGHNWGREHAHEYTWGQCIFPDARGEPLCMVEGFSGRVAIAGVVSPAMSAMVVRRKDETYRFDRVFRLWRQKARTRDLRWELQLRGEAGQALLVMEAQPERVVLLGYRNPDGTLAYCFNSKLARTVLRVNPAEGEPFQCVSEHGGALEFLRPQGDARFGEPL